MSKVSYIAFLFAALIGLSVGQCEAQKLANATSEPVVLDTGTGTLYGTLLVPASKKAGPVVLIIAGSGPTDRDGNSAILSGPNNSLKMLADGLAQAGIASLRYDKRGIGESRKTLGNQADLRFDLYVRDAEMWVKKMRSDKRFTTVTVAGHSEGSLIGMVAAKNAGADGYISIAGVGKPANLILHDQFKPQLPEAVMKRADEVLDSLAAGKTVESYPPELVSIFHPTIQPYVISWFKYDPTKEIAKLKIPALIVQGTSDAQVTVGDANLLSQSYKAAKLVLIEGMNHVLKYVDKDADLQKRSYTDPSIPIEPKLVAESANFIKKSVRRR